MDQTSAGGDTNPEPPGTAALRRVFETAGTMTPLLHACDWGATSLGPPDLWPQSLRSAASICFGAKYPIAIYWGRDLSLIYNEAWSVIPGDKHPWALGRPGAEVWPDIWHIVGPEFAKAMSGDGTFVQDRLLPMQRRGYLEETYFNYNLSPIVAEDGVIAGVFNAGIETTQRVLGERRQRVLLDLTAAAARTSSVLRCCEAVVTTLAGHSAEVPFAQLYLLEDGAMRIAASTVSSRSSVPDTVELDSTAPDPWRLRDASSDRSSVVIEGIDRYVADLQPADDWPEPASTAVVIPVLRGGRNSRRRVQGALVVGVPPGLVIDESMKRFHDTLGDEVASALTDARRDEAERRRVATERRIASTLQQSLIPALPALPSVSLDGIYLPGADGVEVGGDWYDALELPDGRVGLVIGDVVGKGVTAAAEMGQLSNATRAYMLEGYGPSEVLNRLNRLTRSVAGSTFATVLCLDFAPTSGVLRWSRAGHLPPLVRRADGSVQRLDAKGSAPIGVFDDEQPAQWTTNLAPGDTLVLYTDGLIERRDEDIDVGMDRLATVLTDEAVDDSFAERVVESVVGDDRRDDVAILVLRA